jgi:hypothetical protein
MIVASVALLIALGRTSYAAIDRVQHLPVRHAGRDADL